MNAKKYSSLQRLLKMTFVNSQNENNKYPITRWY